MKRNILVLAAAALAFAAGQAATAQSYTPTPPIAKPVVLPKPVANRLIKRQRETEDDKVADN